MSRISATLRIAFGLTCLTVSLVFAASTLRLIPDDRAKVMEGRRVLCESIAIQSSLMVSRNDPLGVVTALEAIVSRNDDIVGAAVRKADGTLLAQAGKPLDPVKAGEGKPSDGTLMRVPVTSGGEIWGHVEVGFRPLSSPGLAGLWESPTVRLVAFVGVAGLVVFSFYLRKMLQHLDPSRVVPERVRSALDTLAAGLLLMDKNERIVLANTAFAETVKMSPDSLQGQRASALPWQKRDEGEGEAPVDVYPWSEAMARGKPQLGTMLGLIAEDKEERTFVVNASPIKGDDGSDRGVLASFDDITALEKKKRELVELLEVLRNSREEIRRQNEELTVLATRDPLTNCLNRRSFFEAFESHWQAAQRSGEPLSVVMIDIDHFKSVNDEHGHAVGDDVLRETSALLHASIREYDLLCRYGGEEFCLLMPGAAIDAAARRAESLRAAIAECEVANLSVTATLGVSSVGFGATSPQDLLNEADKCLYVGKRNGRNQVVRRDEVPDDVEVRESSTAREGPKVTEPGEAPIPFHAVAALISALNYRHAETAEHSRRVADLCMAVGSELMSVSEAYVLETGALLHDIGKIGVPDSILLKPGKLTQEEWVCMSAHERIGVEIIRSTFASEKLAEIVRTYKAPFAADGPRAGFPAGEEIPLAARILAIADAYDAMTTDRSYRQALSHDAACDELRRCAGKQFDPELVERFIAAVSARDQSRRQATPGASKRAALGIGMQIERLASALDNQDLGGLAALAGRLVTTARTDGIPAIAELAERLERSATQDPDVLKVAQLTQDLLELCRSTQRAYLSGDASAEPKGAATGGGE